MRTRVTIFKLRHFLIVGISLAACISMIVLASDVPTKPTSSSLHQLPTEAPARLGFLGEPERLSFEGLQSFTEGAIRRALQSDWDYLVASHPEAPLAECLAALEDRMRAGYRRCGFRDVAVQSRFDVAGRLAVKVIEGPRFRCGALEVRGLTSIPIADFIRRFTEKLAPAAERVAPPPGIWKTGDWVSFTPESLAAYSAAASNTFAALGRFGATFKVEIQPQLPNKEAALAVIVEDEGPLAVLGDIEVEGNRKNRRNAVIGFLGLSRGMNITQDLIDEKARALMQSARFADSFITPTVLGRSGEVSLRINVVENTTLPPLKQPLSREEKTLLQMREWLLAWQSRQEDLTLTWWPQGSQRKGLEQIEVTLAPSGGIAVRLMGNSPGQEKMLELYSMIFRTDTVAFFAQVHQRKLRIPSPTGYSGVLFAKLSYCAECPHGFALRFGAGLSPAQTKADWRVQLELLPAALSARLYRPGTKATWQGNVLTVRTEDLVLRVEEGIGRLLELGTVRGPTSRAGVPDVYNLKVRFSAGAFAKAVDEIETSTSTYPDLFRKQRALGSALGFMASELVMAEPLWTLKPGRAASEPATALASALEKLLTSSCLDPFQTLLDGTQGPPGERQFTIPPKPTAKQDASQEMLQNAVLWCAGHAGQLAPAGSWLQILLREAAFSLSSKNEHTSAALARLRASEDVGPLGCYLAVHALHWSNQGSLAVPPEQVFRRLNTEDFRRDYRMLLDPGSVLTRCLANLVRELGTLTKPEVEAIAGLLSADIASLVRNMAAAATQAKDLPAIEAFGPTLDRWWETSGQAKVEADVRFHAQPAHR